MFLWWSQFIKLSANYFLNLLADYYQIITWFFICSTTPDDITKKCINELLEELQNSGKIMTSSELAEHIQRTVELPTEEKVPEQSTPSDTQSSNESRLYKEEHGHPSSTTKQK